MKAKSEAERARSARSLSSLSTLPSERPRGPARSLSERRDSITSIQGWKALPPSLGLTSGWVCLGLEVQQFHHWLGSDCSGTYCTDLVDAPRVIRNARHQNKEIKVNKIDPKPLQR